LERERILRLAVASKFQKKSAALPPITTAPRADRMPLSFAQQSLWFMEQMEPGHANYNVPVVLRLKGEVDTALLELALAGVVERHEILRTRFELSEDDEVPFQQIDPPGTIRLQRIHLVDAGSGVEEAAQQWIAQQAHMPFDLTRGPLLRAGLAQAEDGRTWLCLVMHHAIVDGWSVDLLLSEMADIYAGHRRQRPVTLPALPVQYADFAVWQRQWLTGEVYEQQRQYWVKQLQGLEPLEMPVDFPRPPVPSLAHATARFILPPELKQNLQRLSQSEGATLFMTFLAAFQVLLARYSGQTDIALGTPVANRSQPETEDLIGYFVNTLVLRTYVDLALTFRQLLQQVRATCLEAYEHQDMPFDKLVVELQPERDLSRSPLFQVMFALQSVSSAKRRAAWESCGFEATIGYADKTSAKFDLYLNISNEPGELYGDLDYNADLFTEARVRRLLQHYVLFLSQVAASADVPISKFSLLTDAEEHQLRVWNQTERLGGSRATLVSLFEEQVKRTPRSTALISGASRLNYLDLNYRANQLARHLVQLGVRAETLVGIYLERSIDAVVAILAVLKAGAAYVSLDPEYPQERLSYMIRDASLNFILTCSDRRVEPLTSRARCICLDTDWLEISRGNPGNLNLPIAANRIAYLIYTSGSTGCPKGVLGTHHAMVNRLVWMHSRYPYGAAEVCCALTSLSFVDSISETFGPLLKGVPLVLFPPKFVLDLPQLTHVVAAQRVSRMLLVPSLLEVLLEAHDSGHITLPRLSYWLTSGEAISLAVANRLFEQDPATRLINLYGSSEVAGDVAWHEMSQPSAELAVPIGRPILNTSIHILDRHLQPVPVGIEGEIFVGGANLARGYLNQSALTAERFYPDPFAARSGSRMYRTGDFGRYLPDGRIVVHGRKDRQVKIRGHRVELGEVESVLLAHPGIRQAVVIPREGREGNKKIHAYFVPVNGSKFLVTELRSLLKSSLPSYMQPASLTELKALPMTSNWKVDRRALPDATNLDLRPSAETEPQTDLERVVSNVWKDLLTLDRVGLDDNFFDLGGHSLQLVRLRNRLRRATGRDVSIIDMFRHTTIRGLVASFSES